MRYVRINERVFVNGTKCLVSAAEITISRADFMDTMARAKRNHEIAERVSPNGLVREAVEYYCCAVAAEKALRLEIGIAISPVNFLLGHSIELGLKSFLRKLGYEPDALKFDFRHDLLKCLDTIEQARSAGDSLLSPPQREMLAFFNDCYRGKDFEYFGTGAASYPYFEPLRETVQTLLNHALRELAPPHFLRGNLAELYFASSSSNA